MAESQPTTSTSLPSVAGDKKDIVNILNLPLGSLKQRRASCLLLDSQPLRQLLLSQPTQPASQPSQQTPASPSTNQPPSDLTFFAICQQCVCRIDPRPLISKEAWGEKIVVCQLCGHDGFDPSPLNDAAQEDCYGGCRPWKRYRKSICQQFKIPRDKICLICWITFSASSFRLLHGDPASYLKAIDGKPEEHSKYKQNVKTLIAKVNEGIEQGKTGLEMLKSLSKFDKPLETVTEDCLGQSYGKPCIPGNLTISMFSCLTCIFWNLRFSQMRSVDTAQIQNSEMR